MQGIKLCRNTTRTQTAPRCALPTSACVSARATRAPRPRARCNRGRLNVRAFQLSQDIGGAADQLTGAVGSKARLSWAGAGIFFFWQLGALKFLLQRYDLAKVPMAGASGGALAAVLAACRVDPDYVLERAYAMSVEEGIWDRRFGLLGVWGGLIERWLDDLLPDNAADLCRDHVTVVVTTLPQMQQIGITDFRDKKDLINICMASSHIPLFLDYQLARKVRGQYCMDGSLPDFFYNDNCDILKADAIIFDYFEDPELKRSGRFEMLSLKTYDEVLRINQCGYDFARRLEEKGELAAFTRKLLNMDTPPPAAVGAATAQMQQEVVPAVVAFGGAH